MAKGNPYIRVQYLKIKDKKLPYSSRIEIIDRKNKNYELHIKDTTANMQEDFANIESIAVWMWSVDQDIKVKFRYDTYHGEKDKGAENRGKPWNGKELIQPCYRGENGHIYAEATRLHHMRFLYRVMRFSERYKEKFELSDKSNQAEVYNFRKLYNAALNNGKLRITEPETEAGLKDGNSKKIARDKPKKVLENHLEKWFVLESDRKELIEKTEIIEEVAHKFGNNKLYDQMPCCVFYENVAARSRIFNSGYFDLWGINDKQELCVFELKKTGNNKLGIISELFFYAMIMKDMKVIVKRKHSDTATDCRGFNVFKESKENKPINAFFLVPELHWSLKTVRSDFIKVLNEVDDGIQFDVIEFKEDKLIEDDIYKNLKDKWKEYLEKAKAGLKKDTIERQNIGTME